MSFQVREVDREFYRAHLEDFLPDVIFDVHTHIWRKEFRSPADASARGPVWPRRVAEENTIEELLDTYAQMFPGKQVTPLIFGWPERNVDLERTNAYTSRAAEQYQLPALLVTTPSWSASEVEERVRQGGFIGLKPYVDQAPPHIPAQDITIYDFLPRHHLAAADAHGWLVMLHLPRPARLRDALNLQHLLEIEATYPNVKLIVAHIGRAYCAEDVGEAFTVLRVSRQLLFDFSANTNAQVMEQALRAFGPQRILFGSDLPIVRMRMRRICEEGRYVNLVPPGLYGDLRDDPHMREVSAAEGEHLTFFLYEALRAFRRAAAACGLSAAEIADVFHGNAARLIATVERG
ncbi:MAG: amidohydrolase [Anaerolineae bacterium]|nr:amidohydrolase [Anaerolineae bacterium]MDW8071171.1 amidohydrolase family protein [Anaerolineae bacterium]